jgi:hypothetical protein
LEPPEGSDSKKGVFRLSAARQRNREQAPPFRAGCRFSQNESFTQFFSKNCGFQRQRLWSLIAMSEILYPVKRIFRVNCRAAARGGFLQEKKPPCVKKYETASIIV